MCKVKTNILNSLLIVFTFVFFTSLFLINSVKASDVVFSINRATIKEKSSNVTNMSSMFNNCSSLENLNITSFDTSKVTDMNRMLASMETITSLDLSSFNTLSVINMKKMFSNMKNIETIYASDNFVTTSVTNGNQMFVYDTINPSIDQPNAKLTGGEGTTYNKNHLGKEYAHIDDPDNGNPGYFTRK